VISQQNAAIMDTQQLSHVAMATIFSFYIWCVCVHWHHLARTTEPSVCGGDAALCQITLTTCCCLQQPGEMPSKVSIYKMNITGMNHSKNTHCERE